MLDARECVAGTKEVLTVKGWSARLQGTTYVASRHFSAANGYTPVLLLVASESVTTLANEISLARSGDSLDDKLWLRGNCPVPHSGECSFVGDEVGGLVIRDSRDMPHQLTLHLWCVCHFFRDVCECAASVLRTAVQEVHMFLVLTSIHI